MDVELVRLVGVGEEDAEVERLSWRADDWLRPALSGAALQNSSEESWCLHQPSTSAACPSYSLKMSERTHKRMVQPR